MQECFKCGGEIEQGEIGVYADLVEDECEGCVWHPFCFTCHTCDELLVDLGYFHKDGQIYCERHYAEQILPRCIGCDEVSYILKIFFTTVSTSGEAFLAANH